MLSQKVVNSKSRSCVINLLNHNIVAIALKPSTCCADPNTLVAGTTGLPLGTDDSLVVYQATVTSVNPLYPFLPALTAAATRSKTVFFGRPMIASLVP